MCTSKVFQNQASRRINQVTGPFHSQRLLRRIEIREDILRKHQANLIILRAGRHKHRIRKLRLQERHQGANVANRKDIPKAHRLVHQDVCERLRVRIQTRSLGQAFTEDVTLTYDAG